MTDIEKIKAEIERLKNEDYGDGYHDDDVATCALDDILSFIESMEQQQSQGLDEAAEKAGWEWACKNKLDPYSMGQAYSEGHKAGAKWMAEQGETSNGVIKFVEGCNDDDTMVKVILLDVNPKNYELNEKVIVQIRRKED